MEGPPFELSGEEPEKKPKRKSASDDKEYLSDLRDCEFQAIDQFDKTILTLTAAAFGVSFAFLKDIVKLEEVTDRFYLKIAWGFWCLALALTLSSFYWSHLAHRRAQKLYRAGERDEAVLGGWPNTLTRVFSPVSGLSFIFGLISMSVFVTRNLDHEHKPTATTATNATATASAKTNSSASVSATTVDTTAPTGTKPR